MAGIEGIAADTREEFRDGVVFEEALSGIGGVEAEKVGPSDGGDGPRVEGGLNPADVLNSEFERVVIRVKPEERRPSFEIEDGQPPLAVAGGEEEVGGGERGVGGEDVDVAEGMWGPSDRGDKGGQRRRR